MELRLLAKLEVLVCVIVCGVLILVLALSLTQSNDITMKTRMYSVLSEELQELRLETIKNKEDKTTSDVVQQPHTSSLTAETRDSLPICELDSTVFKGRQNVSFEVLPYEDLDNRYNDSKIGGRFRPMHCEPEDRIAIIIPYRDRENHLKIFLNNMIPILKRQLADFTIYVIEQAPGVGFNRGMMRNIGFIEAKKRGHYTCFVFNDVDTILEDDRNLYRCGTTARKVRHLMNGCSRHNYRLPYEDLTGGVVAFTKEQFLAVNGYSNKFFIWGGEDDDISNRLRLERLTLERPIPQFGWYSLLDHKRDARLSKRFDILKSIYWHSEKDGLNSLNYTVLLTELRNLYTWIYVKIDGESSTTTAKN